jgi:hypothetical protein
VDTTSFTLFGNLSFFRVGIFLKKRIGLSSTYEGDLVHELPMMLNIYELFLSLPVNMRYIFTLFDAINALLVFLIAKRSIYLFYVLEKRDFQAGKYDRLLASHTDRTEIKKFMLCPESFSNEYWSLIAFGAYLFNPFCIASCVAQSTVIISNTVLLLWFYFLVKNKTILALFFLAVHANLTIYSASLIVASIFFVRRNNKQPLLRLVVKNLLPFMGMALAVFAFNLWLEDFNTRFIKCTYLFILEVPDLVPNLGVFW